MEKTENDRKEEADRRQDFSRRLRIAIRRAHDPVFVPLKPPPPPPAETIPGAPDSPAAP